MAKGRFGGDTYKPKQLGPEPAPPAAESPTLSPSLSLLSEAIRPTPRPTEDHPAVRTRVLSDKVPFSSRVSPATQQQLARLVDRTGRPVTHLLDEALTDLFAKYNK